MDPQTYALVLAAFLVAAFLKGITGLGFSTICLGLLASFVDLKLAIPLAIIPSLSSNVIVMVDAGRFREAVRRFWPLFVSALPGIALGLWLLDTVDGRVARAALGVVLFAYGAWALRGASSRLGASAERLLAAPVGAITGVVNGLTGSQVMPVLPFLLSLGLDTNLFVQSINISFTLSSLAMLAGLGRIGLLSGDLLLASAIGIVPVAIGIRLGGRIRRRISDAGFRRLVLLLLIGLGASLVLRSL